jgi:2',3'-cyclic-nucleotide 2'-phosphodiesterase (5'-nucleotidase family)
VVKLHNYNIHPRHFVLFLTFWILFSCAEKRDYIVKIEGVQNQIGSSLTPVAKIDSVISPYRQNIDNELNTILAYAPETLDKFKGEWQTTIGSLMADVMLEKSRIIFQKQHASQIDLCLLNHGGIRAPIPMGNVTTRTAFEVMPFENSLIVIPLKSEQIIEMTDYIIREKKPHPLSGMTFRIEGDQAVDILIDGKPLKKGGVYHVVTSDYLSNGGDNMNFFKKTAAEPIDLNMKIRDVLIDYFKEVDTIPVVRDVRIQK